MLLPFLVEEASALMELRFIVFLLIENRFVSIRNIHLYTRLSGRGKEEKDIVHKDKDNT